LHTANNVITPINIWGIKGGITYKDIHNFGIGLYSIKNSSSHIRPKDGVTIAQNLDFKYATLFYEYAVINTRWWQIGIPIEAGFGTYKITNTNETTERTHVKHIGNVFPVGSGINVYFNPMPWCAINVFGGYRYVLNTRNKVDLNNWFYSVGGAVYLHPIVEQIQYRLKKHKYLNALKLHNSVTD
jgi:hypothetical protein